MDCQAVALALVLFMGYAGWRLSVSVRKASGGAEEEEERNFKAPDGGHVEQLGGGLVLPHGLDGGRVLKSSTFHLNLSHLCH